MSHYEKKLKGFIEENHIKVNHMTFNHSPHSVAEALNIALPRTEKI